MRVSEKEAALDNVRRIYNRTPRMRPRYRTSPEFPVGNLSPVITRCPLCNILAATHPAFRVCQHGSAGGGGSDVRT